MKIQAKKKLFRDEQYIITDWTPIVQPIISLEELINMDVSKKALQIDGGGILGIIPGYQVYSMMYYYMQQHPEVSVTEVIELISSTFDDFYGTSTGSIIVAGLYLRLDPKVILEFYITKGPQIFQDRSFIGKLFRQSLYKKDYLEKILQELLGDVTFAEAYSNNTKQTLNIAVVSRLERKTIICNHKNTPDMPIWKAVRASSAAPMYFPPFRYNDQVLLDGGTATYNCLLEKAIDKYSYGQELDPDEFYILSMGCGWGGIPPKATEKQIKKAMGSSKLSALMFTITYGREETINRQVKKMEHLKHDIGLQCDRYNVRLPKGLDDMAETDNINEIVDLIEGRK